MNNYLTRRTCGRLMLKAGALLVSALYIVPRVNAQTVNQGVGRGPGGRWTVDFAGVAQPVTVGGTVTVTFTMPSLVAGSALIGHVITDTGSTTAVTGNVTVVQPTGSNLHVAVDSAPTTAVTGPLTDAQLRASRVLVDPSGVTSPISAAALPLPAGASTDASLTITHFVAGTNTAPSQVLLVGGKTSDFTPIYAPIPLTAGGQSLKVDLATVGGLSVTRPLQVDASNTTQPVSAADGTVVTLGALGDSKSTATDMTPLSVISVLKEISFMEQTPASRAVTNAGTFSVQLTGATNNINNISGVVSLPTGAATAARQDTGNAALANIPPQGQALAAGSLPVVLTALQLAALTNGIVDAADVTSAGTTTAPASAMLIAGKTSDTQPVYAPVPLTPGALQVRVRVDNIPAVQQVAIRNSGLNPVFTADPTRPLTADRTAVNARAADVVGPFTVLQSVNDAAYVNTSGLMSLGATMVPVNSFVGALLTECSMDGGSTWVGSFFDRQNASKLAALAFVGTEAALATSVIPMGGCGLYRVRLAAVSAGMVNVSLRATMAVDPSVLFAAPNGSSAVPPATAVVSGVDATSIVRAVSVTQTGMLNTVAYQGPGLPQPICNAVRRYNCQPKGF